MQNILISSIFIGAIILIVVIESVATTASTRKETRKRWPANFALLVINTGINLALPFSITGVAVFAKTNSYGIINWLHIPFGIASVLSFVTISFMMYLFHLSMHKIPLFWRLHQVHHSDVELDVTTAFRNHPIAIILIAVILNTVTFMFGFVAETILVYTTLIFLLDLCHHSSIIWPAWLDTRLRQIIITPYLHHLHHSDYQPETDSNYSVDLCLWDKLFGTYLDKPLKQQSTVNYGLKKTSADDASDLQYLLSTPFKSGQ